LASDKVNYPEVGGIAQAIKYQIRTGGFWDGLTGSSKESLDQIATAIARMVAGDGVHWDAIIGYAHVAKPGTDDLNERVRLEPPTREKGQELEDAMQRLARDRVSRGGQNG
jgi:acyl-CoA-binding protein